jgi:Trypsin-like peptidase domain/Effector-associated domain 8
MNPDVFLEQKEVPFLIPALTRWSQQVIIASDRQDVLNNSGIHQALLNQIKFDNKAPLFANSLVAEIKKYSFSYKKADYHPLVNLLQHLCDRAESEIDEFPEEDLALFGKLLEEGKDKLKALASRHAVGRIESPKGTGIGTGVLIQPDLLLTCNHVVKSQVKEAWVRFNYKSGSLLLDKYLFELDLNLVSSSNNLDYALLIVKGKPQQLTKNPINATLYENQEIHLIHHPLGKPVEISGIGQIVQQGEDYIDHNLRTDNGSSGGPIFNRQWELIAIHQGHPGIGRNVESGTMGGIPIRAIWDKISPHLA